jgi:hypothetical protein
MFGHQSSRCFFGWMCLSWIQVRTQDNPLLLPLLILVLVLVLISATTWTIFRKKHLKNERPAWHSFVKFKPCFIKMKTNHHYHCRRYHHPFIFKRMIGKNDQHMWVQSCVKLPQVTLDQLDLIYDTNTTPQKGRLDVPCHLDDLDENILQ